MQLPTMASAATRASVHERRANGMSDGDRSRPRVSTAQPGYNKHERLDSKQTSSPHPSLYAPGTSHKRSASGNPRPASRATEERRVEERRTEIRTETRTERAYLAHLEALVPGSRSPERRETRAERSDRSRPAEPAVHRPLQTRPKEPKVEPLPGIFAAD